MRLALATLMLGIALPAFAAERPPHWQETLAQDIGGPRVQMTGQVEQVLRDGDYTCFVLSQMADYSQAGGQRFLACGPGAFGGAAFSPGALLQVTGNLGAPQPRKVAGMVVEYPIVAAPLLQPSSVVPWRYGYPDPWWGAYPDYRYDPWYRPWYGPGPNPYWGLHYRYWR